MKFGYNRRIRKKIAKVDADFDFWYWLVCDLAARARKDSSRENLLKLRKIYKFQLSGCNNCYYNATKLGGFSELLRTWRMDI